MDWLKEEFQKADQIDSNKGLSSKAKNYLKIIHGEKYLQAVEPSKSDRLALKDAYGKAATFSTLFSYCTIITTYKMSASQINFSRSLQNLIRCNNVGLMVTIVCRVFISCSSS